MQGRRVVCLLVAGVLTAGLWSVAAPALAVGCPMEPVSDSRLRQYEGEFLRLVNEERGARGLRTLAPSSDIARVARPHAQNMASEERVYHHPNSGEYTRVGGAGEVVGRACSPQGLFDGFMGSPAHRRSLLASEWSTAGVGIGSSGSGMLYAASAFGRPAEPDPTPVPATPTPVAASEPAVRAEPQPATPEPAPQAPPTPSEVPAPTPEATATPDPEPVDAPVGLSAAEFELLDTSAADTDASEMEALAASSTPTAPAVAGAVVALLSLVGLLAARRATSVSRRAAVGAPAHRRR